MIIVDLKQLSDDVEQVSQVYAERFGIEHDATWFLLKLQEEVGELPQAFLMVTGQARDKGRSQDEVGEAFRQEVADVFCQSLLIARFHDICGQRRVVGVVEVVARQERRAGGCDR